jgi:hypothetical protein
MATDHRAADRHLTLVLAGQSRCANSAAMHSSLGKRINYQRYGTNRHFDAAYVMYSGRDR